MYIYMYVYTHTHTHTHTYIVYTVNIYTNKHGILLIT